MASDGTPATARPRGGCDGGGSARDEEEAPANADGAAVASGAAEAAVPGGGPDVEADAKAGGVPKQAPAGAERPSAAPAAPALEEDAEPTAGAALLGCDPR